MDDKKSSYRQIFKATSLFGGVQVFQIIISVIRSKFIAVLLGPTGMGISGLLTSSTSFIAGLTNFGLGTSAVKNVATAAATNDGTRVSAVVSILRRLVWFTGLLGLILTVILAPWLSQLTFGNKDFALAFVWLSVTLLFKQLSSGQLVVLQGLRKLQYLARANILGASVGLLISVPIYYIWKIKGIVPVIIISSFISLLLSWYYARKVGIKSVEVTNFDTISEGKAMVKMGIILSISGLISLGASYIVKVYISNFGGIEQVGLYNAGFAIINTYVGMVFTAMGTDYYPRLSAVANDNLKCRRLINQQAEIAVLILAPILAIFLVLIDLVVILLYSQKFVAVNEMIHWAALGMYFKAATWSIGFILIAKGASKVFFWNEVFGNTCILVFNIVGYKLKGLEGLGISFLVAYFVYFIQIFSVAKLKYSFSFDKLFYKVAGFQLLLGLLCFGIMRELESPWKYFLGSMLIIISTSYSLKQLEMRVGLKEFIQTRIRNFKDR